MKHDEIHRNFLGALEKKLPEKTNLVDILTEILSMERGAVYRRLRGEVPFSLFEVVNIAEKLDISLNNLIYSDSVQTNHFELNIIEYANMSDTDYKKMENYLLNIHSAKDDPHSELAESSNVLPMSIYAKYDSLSKFFLFKYQYLFSSSENRIPFHEMVIPERLYTIHRSYFEESKNFAHTVYIWDYLIFHYLITDLQFFYGINLISENDICQIKEDLFSLINYIEQITLNGYFEETENPVSIYISDINFDADYSYVQLNDTYISLIRTFILNSVVSNGQLSFIKIKNWIQSLKKSSVLITQSAAIYRTDFFEKQRLSISEL